MAKPTERWHLRVGPSEHVVEIGEAGLGRVVTWLRDGCEVASRRSSEDKVVLDGGDSGALRVQLPQLVGPARRVTWYSPEESLGALAAAHTGLGGTDLDPEPGSKAAQREAWIREHPRQYAARRTAAAAAAVLVPLLLLALLSRIHLPWPTLDISWPSWDLPSIPWPDIPWPDIPWPDISWPDLPQVPEWVREVIEKAKYVWPVLLAFVLARAEIRRRRRQDEQKAEAEVQGPAHAPER
jgi:hypothetical protein